MLTSYITETLDLLHDPNETYFTSTQITNYINRARNRIAGRGQCVRVLLSGGTITELTLTNSGSGYSGTVSVAIAGNGQQATATATTGPIPPLLYADPTTEGITNHYWYNGASYASFAALLTGAGTTFTRGSPKYVLGSGGILTQILTNAVPFNYSLTSVGTIVGLSLEGAATNLQAYSQAFATTWNSFSATVTNNAGVAPDGTSTASALTSTASNTNQGIFQGSNQATVAATTTYTHSVYAKPNGYNYFGITQNTGGPGQASYTLTGAGAVNAVSGTGVTAAISLQPSGYYRCSMTWTTTTSGPYEAIFYTQSTANTNNFMGDGSSGTLIWGSQIELGANATSYIPTPTATAVARSADDLLFPFIATGGTLYAKTTMFYETDTGRIIDCGTGFLEQNSGPTVTASNGTNTLSASTNAWTAANTIAMSGSSTGRLLCANGGTVSSDSNPMFSAATTSLQLGANSGLTSNSYGNFQAFAWWSGTAATATQLQTLTTTPGTGSGLPTWVPVFTNGVTGVTLTNGGWGYIIGTTTTVTITGSVSGNNAVVTPTIDQSLTTLAGQEVYKFSTANVLAQLQMVTLGVQSIVALFSVSVAWGANAAMKPTLDQYGWTDFQAYLRSYNFGLQNYPTIWAQYSFGVNGSVYLWPQPSQPSQMDWDAYCLPVPLVTDSTPEAIPYPWTSAVPYYAAELALRNAQRSKDDIDSMHAEYERRIQEATAMTQAPFVSSYYQDDVA